MKILETLSDLIQIVLAVALYLVALVINGIMFIVSVVAALAVIGWVLRALS